MDSIITAIRDFFATSYGTYVVIAAAVVIVAIACLVICLVVKAKRKRAHRRVKERVAAAEAMGDMTTDGIDVDKLLVSDEPINNTKVSGDFVLKPPMRYVSADTDSIVMTAVPVVTDGYARKSAPILKNAPVEEEESSFKEHIYSEEAGKHPGTIQIYMDNGGKYRFRFIASNHETVGHSQGYKVKASCKKGIKAAINAIESAEVIDTTKIENYVTTVGHAAFEIYRDMEDKFRFRLVAANATTVLASQGYTSKFNCVNGTKSVINVAKFHNIKDDTSKSAE